MIHRLPQTVLLWLAVASFLAQSTGAMSFWGLVHCVGCESGTDRITFACSPAQESNCCEGRGHANDNGGAAHSGAGLPVEAAGADCGCTDLPIQVDELRPAPRVGELPADLQAPPLQCAGMVVPAAEPVVRRSVGVCCLSPPRQLIPSSRSTVLII